VGYLLASYRGWIRGSYLADHFWRLFVTANVFAVVASVVIMALGRIRRSPKQWFVSRSLGEDFWLGAELNPHLMGVDIKFFSYRPAMIGWALGTVSFMWKHWEYHANGRIHLRMILYAVFTLGYILDYFVHEPLMTSTFDIIAEHFGFMLIWGDYVFIAFLFGLQNVFLWKATDSMSPVHATACVVIFLVGFAIFRGSNAQKHAFKQNPRIMIWGKPAESIHGRLLVSGYWRYARHMNYFGDLLLAVAFCLPCGAQSPWAWFYFIYLLLLLLNRDYRDEQRCAAKYGELWDQYRSIVPSRIVPLVY